MDGTFRFYECFALTRLTGRKASDVLEFLEILKSITAASIFHHMHQYFLKPHVIAPEYPNDFAIWISESLGEDSLAEAIANVNPFEFSKMEDLRSEIVRIITDYLRTYPMPRPVLPGREFLFNEGVTLVIPTGIEARNLHEFVKGLREADFSSIYFHFYEARLRLGKESDDFSQFLEECLDCQSSAGRIRSLDPYMFSTEVLRTKLINIIEEGL